MSAQRRWWALRRASLVTLVVLLVAVAASVWGTATVVHDDEASLLRERTSELELALDSSIGSLRTSLRSIAAVLRATGADPGTFARAAAAESAGSASPTTVALVRSVGGRYLVAAEAGKGPRLSGALTGAAATALTESRTAGQLVSTSVFRVGGQRRLGFALGPPQTPTGSFIFQEEVIGPAARPPTSSTAYHELDVIVYAASRPAPAQVLVSTAPSLRLHGERAYRPLQVGASTWLIGADARAPLVGRPTADAPWLVLGGGLAGAVLVAATIETIGRRRDLALELYAVEHQVGETLQRSLLPTVPQLPGLDIATRYLAGGRGQEVGGDWFDVFALPDGRVGVAVGDVIGHDVAAATAMAQIRSALRAYAVDGEEPAGVLDRLARLVEAHGLATLVTVVYGILDPPAATGDRLLRFTNAGHLPPMLLEPDGTVRGLEAADSLLIGVPADAARTTSRTSVPAGATLLLFTDGLVELPGRSIEESLRHLEQVVAGHDPAAGASELCERVLREMGTGTQRDDIALLALRVLPQP